MASYNTKQSFARPVTQREVDEEDSSDGETEWREEWAQQQGPSETQGERSWRLLAATLSQVLSHSDNTLCNTLVTLL